MPGVAGMMFTIATWVRSSPARAWSLSLAAFAVALATRFATDSSLPAGFPYLTFFPAVILTTFFAGVWPGSLCAVLSGFSAWYWFIAPHATFAVGPSVLIALAFYVFVVGVDIVLIHVMHEALEDLEAERAVNQRLLEQQGAHVQELKARQRQQLLLQRELSHRMKNTLAMVQAVVSQSLKNASDPKEAAAMAAARIQALARAQDVLTATDWAASALADVVKAAVAPLVDGGDRITITGPNVEVEARHALGLALAIHELATNATKYGALSVETGTVAISWSVTQEGGFVFEWRERDGPPVTPPQRRGFGSRLTERVVPGYFGGQADMRFEPSGVIYELTGSLLPVEGTQAETSPA